MGRRREIGFQTIGIYKITSPSGKIYIGQSWNIGKRLSNYKSVDRTCKEQPKLYNSLKKYGSKSHEFEIAHELPKDVEQSVMDGYEQLYMDLYRYCGIELMNIKEGGSRGKWAQESKLKIRNAKLGIKRSAEVIDKMSKGKRGKTMGEDNHYFGKKHSEEVRKKMSESQKKRCARGDHPGWGRPQTEESKKKRAESMKGKYGNCMRGKKHTQESKDKMSAWRTGKPMSEETKNKIRLANLGRKMPPYERKKPSQESIKKMADALRGRKLSEETKAKISAANKGKLSGRKRSKEAIEKMVATFKSKKNVKMDNRSITNLNTLHPKFRQSAIDAWAKAQAAMPSNVQIIVIQGLRTFAESNALYAQGRTEPGPIVTDAPAGESYHNYGLAFDFAMVTDGKDDYAVGPHWMKVVEIMKAAGMTWGGDFPPDIVDNPHFENKYGHNWRDLLALYNAKKFTPGTEYVDI